MNAIRPATLPSVDRILRLEAVVTLCADFGRPAVTRALRARLDQLRAGLRAGTASADFDPERLVHALRGDLRQAAAPRLRPVFNLSGTVLHTNLGRALLAESAVTQVVACMRTACSLEFDLATGERGDRDEAVEALLCELTGAEAATVVNNNAAAVVLTIAGLAAGREVLLSRGELVEIGGAFRMPDVMVSAGARLVEVGTTNRTHEADYVEAITPATALLMKVHTSNYAIQGYTAAVDESRLAEIAHAAGLPLAVDLGSGSLIDLSGLGLPREPMPRDTLRAGADAVTFSGDKLLGGPQAGLIVGRREVIGRIRRHPLKRAFRVSKLVMAALEATLQLYRHPERLMRELPTLRLLTRPLAEIEALGQRLLPRVQTILAGRCVVALAPVCSQIGSGSLPLDLLPSCALALSLPPSVSGRGGALQALAAALRRLPVPVIGRIRDDRLLLDLRCLEAPEAFLDQLAQLVSAPE